MKRYKVFDQHFINRINEYEFYHKDTTFQDLIKDEVMNPNHFNNVEKIIEYIETNNETTLIGTLNFMNFMNIFSPNNMKPICAMDVLIREEDKDENKTQYVNISNI